jgi:NADP-dependent 3-hydroxy acid dehydrogenase YdfG
VLYKQIKEKLKEYNYSLKHVLIECVDVSDVRQTFYNVNNSTDLFTNVDTILSFKKIDLYAKL